MIKGGSVSLVIKGLPAKTPTILSIKTSWNYRGGIAPGFIVRLI